MYTIIGGMGARRDMFIMIGKIKVANFHFWLCRKKAHTAEHEHHLIHLVLCQQCDILMCMTKKINEGQVTLFFHYVHVM